MNLTGSCRIFLKQKKALIILLRKNRNTGRLLQNAVKNKNSILLHVCCGPCGTASVERLLLEEKEVTLFFSNSNIFPESEFYKRLEQVKKLSEIHNVPCYVDEYDHSAWLSVIKGYEREPEKGKRCSVCFNYSLSRAALMAKSLSIESFTTTLTISPHKISKMIFEKGEAYGSFAPYDFKKKDGFKKSRELSEKYGLYRQNYCGCEFSMNPAPFSPV